jgi:serine phosphatase RsbU (regulator of sigma subunit)
MASQDAMQGRADADLLTDVVLHTNDYIANTHEQANMFATVFFGILDPASGALRYINGGHETPLIAAEGVVRGRLVTTGPALGLVAGSHFSVGEARLEPGELLLAFTDGVTDARRAADGLRFSEERLCTLFKSARNATELLDHISIALAEHMRDGERFDDVTLLAVRRRPGREGE